MSDEKKDQAVISVPNELLDPAAFRHYEGEWDCEVIEAGADRYELDGPVHWSVDLSNTGDAILVMGKAAASAVVACARCLEPVEYALEGDIEGYFVTGGEEAEDPEDMEGDEFDVLGEDKKIDLSPLISAALMLELPLVPLCRDDCKGICPTCGADLNEGPCGCEAKGDDPDPDNPFAALKDYSFDR